jgi:hypothetical protein
MKKTFFAIVLLVIGLYSVIAQEPARNFQYDLNEEENGIVIQRYNGNNRNLVIPGIIEGYPVVQIGRGVVGYPVVPNDLLVSLVIPEGVRNIASFSFTTQRYLTSVTFPSTLKRIDRFAFEYCGLRTIRLPDSLEEIREYAFTYNTNLTDANIPVGIKTIGESAFFGCKALSNLTIPASIKSIYWKTDLHIDSFYGCALTIAARRRLVELGYPNGNF